MKARILAQVTVALLMGIVGAAYQRTGLFLALAAGLALWWNRSFQIWSRALGVAACMAAVLLGGWRWQSQQELFRTVEERLEDEDAIALIGRVTRKEDAGQRIVYYVKDSYINSYFSGEETEKVSKNAGQRGWWYAGSGILYLEDSVAEGVVVGDTLQVQGTYQEFQGARNDGNFDRRAFYHGKNISFQGKADSIKRLSLPRDADLWERLREWKEKAVGGWKESLYRLRKRVQAVYERLLPSSQAGILSVMTLGDKGLLEDADKELYRQAGISHVLAISGLHISLLGMGLFRLLRRLGGSYGISGAAAGICLICFGQLAGMEVSTARAVLMFLIMLAGSRLGMAYDSVTALSLSALLQLWSNPAGLWYGGFQFSYAAVLSVVVVSRIYGGLLPKREKGKREGKGVCLRERIKGWLGGFGETVLVSGCIQLATLPLTLWHYFEFPLYTVLINGLLLPFMGLLLFLGLAGGFLGLLWQPAAWLILQPAGLLLQWNETVCRLFLKLPYGQVIAGRPGFSHLCFYYGLLGVCLYLLWRQSQAGRNKGRPGRRPTGSSPLGARLLLALLPAAALVWLAAGPKAAEFRLVFLDVGQGDGIYLKTPEGADFFVDGGSSNVSGVGEYRILPFLKYHGASQIEGWFVTHGDKDHISGLLEVWDRGYPVRRLLLAQGMVRDEAWQELVREAEEHQTQVVYLSPGQRIVLGETVVTCLGPKAQWETEDRNGASLILRVECQGVGALLTGDISQREEQLLCEAYGNLRADVYKAAHHGSNQSNSRELLKALRPSVSIVSCSRKNRYGHPGREAVAHMEEAGSRVFYTMDSGQLTVTCPKGKLLVRGIQGE